MEYVTKHCPVCGKQFVVVREAAHKVECCTLGCLQGGVLYPGVPGQDGQWGDCL